MNGNETLSWSCPRSVLPVARDICLVGRDSRHASKPAEGWLKIRLRRVLLRSTRCLKELLGSVFTDVYLKYEHPGLGVPVVAWRDYT